MRNIQNKTTSYNKKKKEWSKIITAAVSLICTGIAIWCIASYQQLIKLAILNNSAVIPDVTLPVTAITCLLGSILSYLIYQGSLKLSLNKNGLRADSVTGIITAIKDCNVPEVISSAVSNAEDDNYRTNYEEPVNM